ASNLEEVENLQSLSDKLLQLAQHQKPNTILIAKSIIISEIIDEAIHKVQSVAKKKSITLEKKKISKYKITGDKQSLVQLFVILLENAVKYSPEQTIVTLATKSIDHSILITVTDQGIGIDKKDMPHIFDRFYRADSSRTKQDVSGYGLGLSIAKKIIDAHNGDITVMSEKNKGTTFTVQLPKTA
ncbi:MAG TPA: sensor histidine kinase, partial [Candidatus Saccharimonadales bacterium]|nr:sensor histidine kinase [Candidatus Saccharimonadales bacterium]